MVGDVGEFKKAWVAAANAAAGQATTTCAVFAGCIYFASIAQIWDACWTMSST